MNILEEIEKIISGNKIIQREELFNNHIPEYFRKISVKYPKSEFLDIPIKQIYLEYLSNFLEFFEKKQLLMCRDGYWGIYTFFKKNPNPINVKSNLIIPKIFEWLIPDEWKHLCVTYSIDCKKIEEENKNEDVIIYLSVSKSSLNDIPLKKINELSNGRKAYIKITTPEDFIENKYLTLDDKNLISILNKLKNENTTFISEDLYNKSLYLHVDLADMYFDYLALNEVINRNYPINNPFVGSFDSNICYKFCDNVEIKFHKVGATKVSFSELLDEINSKYLDFQKYYKPNCFTQSKFELSMLSQKFKELYEI